MKESLIHLNNSLNGDLKTDRLHQYIYATDASVYRKIPLAVAYPKDEMDIKLLVKFANDNNTSLVPRTAGTSLAGQCVGEGIIVDVSKYFTKILSIDEKNRTVRVQPGVIRDELNYVLKPFNLFFGPNTSTSNRCMIGGMCGNNSSGTTSIKYGVTRDKVLSAKAVLSNGETVLFESLADNALQEKMKDETFEGEIYRFLIDELKSDEVQKRIRDEFPKKEIHRRNNGYAIDDLIETAAFGNSDKNINLSTLLCGSEGTLAFITELELQLDVLPPPYSSMVVTHYRTIDACLNDVTNVMKHNLFTCEMMDDVILNCSSKNKMYSAYRSLIHGDPKALLMLELRALTENDLDKQTKELLSTIKASGLSFSSPVLLGDDIEHALELRKAGLGLLGNIIGDKKAVACIEDTAVALDDLPSFIAEFSALMKSYGQDAVYYAHAGAGELHLRPILNLKNATEVRDFRKITTDVAKLTKKYKGSFSGEHGEGIVRAEFLSMQIGKENYELLRRIKKTFDPNSIFNPGKVVDPYKMDESLRYEIDRSEPEINTFMDFSDNGGLLRLSEKCNGSGDCRKTEQSQGVMCPSYHATKEEKHTTRARANTLREVLTDNTRKSRFDSKELKEVFDLCLSCKACVSECPSSVDMAISKSEFLYQYQKMNGSTFSNRMFAKSSFLNKKASHFPKLVNALYRNEISSKFIKKIMGIAKERSLPNISIKSFSKTSKTFVYQDNKYLKKVYLFVDEFTNYMESELAVDAFELLMGLNYDVRIIDHLDSARAQISKGFLKEARKQANRNIEYLKNLINSDNPLIGIEPSAILSFRDEYVRLADNVEAVRKIADNSYLVEEFIASEIENGNISSSQFTSDHKDIKIHVHCHQKALSNQKVTFDILNLPNNYSPTIINSGCCGMAGSFGYEKDHYEISMKIGELKLFPALRKSDENTIIAANGTSCRQQISDGVQRESFHPVTILKKALIID
jgi:FAD/FMN-containing dehydrogenase/Fe-S oxidoreductase